MATKKTTAPKAQATACPLPDLLRLSAESVGYRAAIILKDRGITLATGEQIDKALSEAAKQFGAEREALQVQKGLTCEQAVLELCVAQ